jgi:hypothetical protein
MISQDKQKEDSPKRSVSLGAPRPGFKPLEVWAAPSVPARPSVAGYARTGAAGLLSAATDRRANSLARLAHVNGSADASERW